MSAPNRCPRSSLSALAAALLVSACGGGSSGNAVAVSTMAPPAPQDLPPVITTPWAPVGPAPSAVEAPVAAHASSGTIYIGSLGGGVFKSTDRGSTFRPVNNGLGSLRVASMVMAADDPNTLYAGTVNGGVYKTTDGGANWAITGETTGIVLVLAIDPTNANVVYAGYNGAVPVRKTTNGGTTWVNANTGIVNAPGAVGNVLIFAIAVDPANPRTVYAAGPGAGAYKSLDAGASWTAMPVDPTLWSLIVDPADSRTVYAGSNGNGVYRSQDAGANFTRMGTPGDGVVNALARAGNTLYAGTASTGLFSSTDGGATWATSSLSTGLVISLSTDSSGVVYAGTALQGVLVSQGGGPAWLPLAVDGLQACPCQDGHAVAVSPFDNRHVLFTTNDGGLIETRNGGRTWAPGGTGLASRSPRSVVFDRSNSQRIYAGSFSGGGFFRSNDAGRTWERRLFGPATIHITGVAVDPSDQSIYVTTLQSGGLWKSTDLGDTFRRIDVGVAGGPFLNLNGRGIAVDPNQPATVYHAGTLGVWRSLDRGATWTRVSTVSASTVTVDPTSSRIVYVGSIANGVLKSTDGGATFVAANVGLTELRTSRTGGVQLHSSNPQTLYVGTEGGGVFKSTDAGGSWLAINGSLTELNVLGLALDPSEPRNLYASTSRSVFKTVTGGQ